MLRIESSLLLNYCKVILNQSLIALCILLYMQFNDNSYCNALGNFIVELSVNKYVLSWDNGTRHCYLAPICILYCGRQYVLLASRLESTKCIAPDVPEEGQDDTSTL